MAATLISRAWYNTLVDDSGSGTDGTIIDKADMGAILDAVDAVLAGTVTFGGRINSDGLGAHTIEASGGGAQALRIINGASGPGNYAAVELGITPGATGFGLYAYSAGYTSSNSSLADGLELYAARPGGISITAVTGRIRFYAGGVAERWRVESNGSLLASSNAIIGRNTTAGADAGSLILSATDAATYTRGAFINLHGNQSGLAGVVDINVGQGGSAALRVWGSTSQAVVSIAGASGLATFTASTPETAVYNGTHANGGYITWQRSGAPVGWIGDAAAVAVPTAGTSDFAVQCASGRLHLEGATVYSRAIANNTTANAANCVVDTSGLVQRSTSSLRYKTDVRPLADWRWLLALQPITFRDRAAPGRRFGGLSAEDVAAHGPRGDDGRPLFAGLDDDGRPDDVAYTHMVAPLVAAVQNLEARLAALEGEA